MREGSSFGVVLVEASNDTIESIENLIELAFVRLVFELLLDPGKMLSHISEYCIELIITHGVRIVDEARVKKQARFLWKSSQ